MGKWAPNRTPLNLPGISQQDPSGNVTTTYPTMRGPNNVPSQSLHSLLAGTGQQQNVDPLQQMLDLEMQAIDAQYGGGGGGGGGAHYSAGPAVANLRSFADQGDTKLADLYANLGSYLQQSADATKQGYVDTTNKVSGYYDQGSKEIQDAATRAQADIAAKAALSPAGQGAAGDSQAAANAAIQRQASIESTNKSNQLASLASLGTGHEAIAREILAGTQTEGAAQRARLQNQVAAQIASVNQQVAAANAKSSASSSNNAGKADAAKLRAMKDYIGAKNTQDTKGTDYKGIKGVISFANKVGQPDLASKFMSMVSASRVKAAAKNQEAKANPLVGKDVTNPDSEFQALLSTFSGPDTNNPSTIMNLIRTVPELKPLTKYIKVNPITENINKIPAGFFRNKVIEQFNQSGQKPTYLDSFAPQDQQLLDRYIQSITQQQDLLGQFYDIYNGKYN